MEVELTRDQQALIRQAIDAGRLQDPEEAARETFSLWEARERRRAEILAAVDIAEASLARGEGRVTTEESMRQLATMLDNVAVPTVQQNSTQCGDGKLARSELIPALMISGITSPQRAAAVKRLIVSSHRSRNGYLLGAEASATNSRVLYRCYRLPGSRVRQAGNSTALL